MKGKVDEESVSLEKVLETIPDLIFVFDRDGHFLNYFAGNQLDPIYPKEVFLGRSIADLFDEELVGRILQAIDESLSSKGIVTLEYYIEDDKAFYEARFNYLTPISVIAIIRNITKRVLAEKALREEKEKFEAIVEDQTEFIVRYKEDGVRTFVNNSYCKYYNISREEALGTSFFMHIAEGSIEPVKQKIEALTKDNPVLENEHEVLLPDGSIGWNRWIDRAIFNNKGEIVEYQSVGNDITEKKRFEQELRKREAMYKNLVETSQDLIWIVDSEGKYVYLNPAWERVMGYKVEEMLGKSFTHFQTDEQAKKDEALLKEILKGKMVSNYRTVHYAKDGTPRILNFNAIRITNEEGEITGTQGTANDLTELINLQEELLQSKKLEALSILAGGIAHDFNNLLTGLTANLSLAKHYIDDKDELISIFKDFQQALTRTSQLSNQLLTFSKGGSPQKDIVKVENLLRESVSFTLSGSNISAEYNLESDLWNVCVDENQIYQVFQNIIMNAINSMPNGGKITINARNLDYQGEAKKDLISGKYVLVEIKDTGSGIPLEIINKVFDPFFTTRSKGSGLGLAICYSIIKNHGGIIELSSKLNQGTDVSIYLPVGRSDSIIKQERAPQRNVKSNSEVKRILLMEDNPHIQNIYCKIFRTLGHGYTVTNNGSELLKLYQDDPEYDILILDLTISGGMGGKETAVEVLNINNNAKIIVASGYSEDPVLANFKQFGFQGKILKPFTLEDIESVIDSV
ncbi:MAG: PAS domain S-box protein [Candidatus Heimdallarchaeota archaeon]|nr:PAS domain S-box protein [Candidatus Heimdallarchaeota archaeon]